MAAKKQFNTIKKTLEVAINKIDLDNVDFGEVKMNNHNKAFELTTQNEIKELISNLESLITSIENKSDKYKNNKVNEKVLETLKSDSQDGEMLRKIFNG